MTRPCADCGAEITGPPNILRCAACSKVDRAMTYRDHCRRRRALKRGALSEPYTTEEIAERDGFICGLCSEPVVMSTPYPDPWSPSIDHIRPLSRGGDDTKANVQLAHRFCNTSKGNRMSA